MRHLQIIKIDINIRSFVAYIDEKVPVLVDRQIAPGMGSIGSTSGYLFKPAVGTDKVKLLVKQDPDKKNYLIKRRKLQPLRG